ncbi:MAG: formimidoylglutamate deiminase, partial [Renibacterium salmoninarum]|nr:formimidoylglutamate deiminase [Renibacterium salmoninarum]
GDRVELDLDSVRTVGSAGDQLPMTATAADVLSVQVSGREIAAAGLHAELGDPAKLLSEAFAELEVL